jgi:SpoU rRNA methylase family enzyme
MTRQTPVEWLEEKLIESGVNLLSEEVRFIEQAKEMEKEQRVYSEEEMASAILFAFDTFSETLSRREMELRAKDFIESLKK